MLRVSWRPRGATLVVEGIVDFEHHDVLTVAAEAALNGGDYLVVDVRDAHCDTFGRLALGLMERKVTALCQATVKVDLHPGEAPRVA